MATSHRSAQERASGYPPLVSPAAPKRLLTVVDAVTLIVGIVVGAGIFKTPSLVATYAGEAYIFLLAWVVGGAASLIGALCYAELATAYPHAGGDYHYLARAFGHDIAFLFAWARMTVMQTGSIAMLGFVFGDYVAPLLPLGDAGASIAAALAIVGLTLINLMSLRQGTWTQVLLTGTKLLGVFLVVLVGLLFAAPALPEVPALPTAQRALGLTLIFVLLTYGGWNEAAYISAELRGARRNMVRSLLWGLGIITTIFLLTNLAYLRGLGLTAMSQSEVVAAELMRRAVGEGGAAFVSVLIGVSVLGAMNATIFTGARSGYALGRDFALFGFLGRWQMGRNTPPNALLTQGSVALLLVLLGTWTRSGFATMVEYTAPVFWFFFLLAGLSLFVLRTQEPATPRPFRVPLYPLTPLIFCITCVYMLHASLAYTGTGAAVGVVVLLAGVPLLLVARRRSP
jgi:APA family basic amino acid/polyamine antiporter